MVDNDIKHIDTMTKLFQLGLQAQVSFIYRIQHSNDNKYNYYCYYYYYYEIVHNG